MSAPSAPPPRRDRSRSADEPASHAGARPRTRHRLPSGVERWRVFRRDLLRVPAQRRQLERFAGQQDHRGLTNGQNYTVEVRAVTRLLTTDFAGSSYAGAVSNSATGNPHGKPHPPGRERRVAREPGAPELERERLAERARHPGRADQHRRWRVAEPGDGRLGQRRLVQRVPQHQGPAMDNTGAWSDESAVAATPRRRNRSRAGGLAGGRLPKLQSRHVLLPEPEYGERARRART